MQHRSGQCAIPRGDARRGVSLAVMLKLAGLNLAALKLYHATPEDVMKANIDAVVTKAFGPSIYGNPNITPDLAGAMVLQRCLD